MAFVTTPVALPRPARATAAPARAAPVMRAAGYSRRAMLRLAVASGLAVAAPAMAESLADELKELKKDVEELNYEEELLDVGPDPREKNPLRTKRKEKEPEYRKAEEVGVDKDEAAFDDMVAKEKAEEEKLRKQFSKN